MEHPRDDERASVFLWAVAGELSVADRVAVVSEFQGKVIQDADDEATALKVQWALVRSQYRPPFNPAT